MLRLTLIAAAAAAAVSFFVVVAVAVALKIGRQNRLLFYLFPKWLYFFDRSFDHQFLQDFLQHKNALIWGLKLKLNASFRRKKTEEEEEERNSSGSQTSDVEESGSSSCFSKNFICSLFLRSSSKLPLFALFIESMRVLPAECMLPTLCVGFMAIKCEFKTRLR